MSKYTTEVRYICEHYAGVKESAGYDSVKDIVEKARPKIFDFSYPIFDENYRKTLETKILRHYYTREICCETVGLWKEMLDNRMNEIMPYFNKLYESELLSFNPFYNVDYTRDFNKTNDNEETTTGSSTLTSESTTNRDLDGTRTENTVSTTVLDGETNTNGTENTVSTGNSTDSGTVTDNGNTTSNKSQVNGGSDVKTTEDVKKNTRWDIYSDTPQGSLNNVDEERYLTNARKITDDGTGSVSTETTAYGKTVQETGTGTSANTRTIESEQTVETEDTKTVNNRQERDDTTTTNQTVSGTNNEEEVTETTSEQTGSTNGTSSFNGLENYLEHMKGKNSASSFSKLLMEFRETFLNIDMLVIDKLNDLFFLLW